MKCPKCGKTGLKNIKAHDRISHSDTSSSRAATDLSDDGAYGGQIGRAMDPAYDFTVDQIIHPRSRSESGTIRILPKGATQPVTVFRGTGVPVVRKVGDRTRHPQEW